MTITSSSILSSRVFFPGLPPDRAVVTTRVRWPRILIVVAVLTGALMALGAWAPLSPGWDGVTLCYPLVGPVQRISHTLADSTRLRIQAHEDQHASDCRQRGAIPHYVELARSPGRLRAESRANCAEAKQQVALGRDAWLELERVIDDLRYGYPWFREQPDSVLRSAVEDACPDLASAAELSPLKERRRMQQ